MAGRRSSAEVIHPSGASGRSAPAARRPSRPRRRRLADGGERRAVGLAELGVGGLQRLRARQRDEQLVVLPAAEGVLEGRRPRRPARRAVRRRAPAPLARTRRPRSVASPSETSIMAVAPWRARTAPSPTRADRSHVHVQQRAIKVRPHAPPRAMRRPAAEAPSAPVTAIRSPGDAPARVTARPGATSPVTVTEIAIASARDRSPPTSHSACSSQASRMPPYSSITHAAPRSRAARAVTRARAAAPHG